MLTDMSVMNGKKNPFPYFKVFSMAISIAVLIDMDNMRFLAQFVQLHLKRVCIG